MPSSFAAPASRLAVLFALSTGVHSLGAQTTPPAEWHDPSPHAERWVVVEPQVQLEVLDWGGKGPAMVFLPGLGNTAHSFDVFAPRFRDAYHVYGITPRGFGASSHPDTGYTSPARARDVLAVLDSLGVHRAILVGHSIAGDEMTRVAVEHPERVHALIYLDAYSYGAEFRATDDSFPPEPPQALPPIPMTSADSASIPAVVAYWARRYKVTPVEAEVRAVSKFSPGGRLEMFQAPHASEPVFMGSAPSDYAHVKAPALAIYARHAGVETLFPEYSTLDSTNRRMADVFFAFNQHAHDKGVAQFRDNVRCGVLRDGVGYQHYVHYAHADEVERLMRDFLANRIAAKGAGCRVKLRD